MLAKALFVALGGGEFASCFFDRVWGRTLVSWALMIYAWVVGRPGVWHVLRDQRETMMYLC